MKKEMISIADLYFLLFLRSHADSSGGIEYKEAKKKLRGRFRLTGPVEGAFFQAMIRTGYISKLSHTLLVIRGSSLSLQKEMSSRYKAEMNW